VELSSLISHSPCGVIKLLTFISKSGMTEGSMLVMSRRDLFSTQLSIQNEIRSPRPTFHMSPCWSRLRLCKIVFHTGESVAFRVPWKKSSILRYLVHIAQTQRLDYAVRVFQASLHWNALLVGSVLRRPNPPIALGRHTLSQASIGNPFSVCDFFQKKFQLHLSR